MIAPLAHLTYLAHLPGRARRRSVLEPWGARALAVLVLAGLAPSCSKPDPQPGKPPVTSAPPSALVAPRAPSSSSSAKASPPAVPAAFPLKLDAPPAAGKNGMVATDAALATQVGVDILKRGGNAVDAAVATALALAVVYPAAGNIGGGGFMVLRTADGKVTALDFRETAPKQATATLFQGKEKPKDGSLVGHLAVGVPGSVAGLWEAHQRHGTLPWAELCAPSIRLAEEGFWVDETFADTLRDTAKELARFPASAALFLPSGKPLSVGATFKNPDLGRVLRRIQARGAAGFYEGETADLLVSEMRRGHGLITHEDLTAYKPRFRDPIEVDYRGYHVIAMPPPSSGGLALALLLKLLAGYDLSRMGWHSTEAIHLEVEAMRRAFALRNQYLGDPDFVKVPLERFLSDASVERLRASISKDRATPSAEVSAGIGGADEKKHTTHFSIVDAKGAAVALTTTINTLYGSAVTVTGGGFVLNNEMDDFATQPGKPNVFGLIQGESNAIAPGKRMLSSMSPTVVVGPDGKVFLVTGAAGGPTIITSAFHVLSNVIDYHLDIVAAVSAPRFHHQHLPDEISYEEAGLPREVLTALGAMGHKLAAQTSIGDAPSLLRQGDGWTGGSEPRTRGSAALGD